MLLFFKLTELTLEMGREATHDVLLNLEELNESDDPVLSHTLIQQLEEALSKDALALSTDLPDLYHRQGTLLYYKGN